VGPYSLGSKGRQELGMYLIVKVSKTMIEVQIFTQHAIIFKPCQKQRGTIQSSQAGWTIKLDERLV